MTTSNQQARLQALKAASNIAQQAPNLLSFRSQGRLLILADLPQALEIASQLPEQLQIGIISRSKIPTEISYPVLNIGQALLKLEGHLGQYQLQLQRDEEWIPVAPLLGWEAAEVDNIIDTLQPPLLNYEIAPFGYFALDPSNTTALQQVLDAVPDLVGEFEKIKYFDYDPSICAHSRSGLTGCNRCLNVCPTGAIISLGEQVEINPYYCQGGGSCATACPSGAITYRYPQPIDLANRLRVLLRHYYQAGGSDAAVVFHSEADTAEMAALPDHVLALELEEIGGVGLEIWLSALAYGARQVVLWPNQNLAGSVADELEIQLVIAQALLQGLGYSPAVVTLNTVLSSDNMPELKPATFAGSNDKRTQLFAALDWLAKQAPKQPQSSPLPAQAPLGNIHANDHCTLCMACVAVCPASALQAGGDTPRLDFIEANCLQCGLCEQACPENAITLEPRYVLSREQRMQRRALREDSPFHCIKCGKAFATQSVIGKMQQKLAGHWMFQEASARERLRMCGDCRVVDMMEEKRLG